MKFKVVKGTFWVKGFSPDGDSIRFVADDKKKQKWFNWKDKNNIKKANENKEIKMQLRLEAIDALETHFNYKYHQPRSFGIAGMNCLLEMLGLKIFKYSIDYTKITEADDGKKGCIISSGLDMYDRPISFIYAGDIQINDGEELDPFPENIIKKSINFQLLEKGIVYPTFYEGIDDNIIKIFSKTTKEARERNCGLWAIDRTEKFTFWETWTIQDDVLILPKLFRRLATFIDDYSSYDELDAYFKKTKDPVIVLSTNQKKNLYELMSFNGQEIGFNAIPEDLLFIPK